MKIIFERAKWTKLSSSMRMYRTWEEVILYSFLAKTNGIALQEVHAIQAAPGNERFLIVIHSLDSKWVAQHDPFVTGNTSDNIFGSSASIPSLSKNIQLEPIPNSRHIASESVTGLYWAKEGHRKRQWRNGYGCACPIRMRMTYSGVLAAAVSPMWPLGKETSSPEIGRRPRI